MAAVPVALVLAVLLDIVLQPEKRLDDFSCSACVLIVAECADAACDGGLLCEVTSVDEQVRAGNETRIVRRQVEYAFGNFVCFCKPAQWIPFTQCVE